MSVLQSHMTYHVTGVGFDGAGDLSLVPRSPRLPWDGNQTLVPNLKLNTSGNTAVLLLNGCTRERGREGSESVRERGGGREYS